MTQIFVFTAGEATARAHLADSVDKPIEPSIALSTVTHANRDELQSVLDREEGLWAWGAIPSERNRHWWELMSAGDWVLAVYESTYHYVARVTCKIESETLARRVWGETPEGETWSLVYFLSRPVKINVSVSSLGSHLNKGYQGFTRIGDERIARITEEFGSIDQFVNQTLLGDFAEVPDGITRDDVLTAIAAIDRGEGDAFGDSTRYDLIHEQRRYPPKQVIGLAAKRVIGRPLRPSEFSGGDASKAFRVLRQLGFRIEPKVAPQSGEWYFLIRSNEESEYTDEVGTRYHFTNTVPNFRALESGGYVVVDRKAPGGPVLVGYGELGQAQRRDENGRTHFVCPFMGWTALTPPRPITPDERRAIQATQGYNVQHAIRPITRETYEMLTRQPVSLLPTEKDLRKATAAFAAALREAGVSFGTQHETLVSAFIASLAAKPLVILTGLSGSGKTQIAIRLGDWLGRERLFVAAVRPDWTGAEALFGYEDGLKPVKDGQPAWVVPEPLAFMLRARDDPQHPYLLVLDEMNLAHVERYFADALSGMESEQPCLPNLARGSDGLWRAQSGGRVPLPKNLWIVGTVNVDETTYMFSPKVLDRANTFEFRVSSSDLSATARKPASCSPGDPALVRGLLAIASDAEWHVKHPATFATELEAKLRQLHDLLERYGYEFGHRMFYEALRFAALAEAAGLEGLNGGLDRIVMQKVLPRLHGGRRRLELPLLALAQFCRDLPAQLASDEQLGKLKPEDQAGPAQLPLSFDKVQRMLRNLRANQFASFTE